MYKHTQTQASERSNQWSRREVLPKQVQNWSLMALIYQGLVWTSTFHPAVRVAALLRQGGELQEVPQGLVVLSYMLPNCCYAPPSPTPTPLLQLLAVFMQPDTRLLLTSYILQPHTQPARLTFDALLVGLCVSVYMCVSLERDTIAQKKLLK